MSIVKWTIDPYHSRVEFKVKHLMITFVTGHFEQFDAEILTPDEDFMQGRIFFTAQSASVSTGNEQRDQHIRSADFLDAERFPQIKFTATRFEEVDQDGSFEMYGDLTIRSVTLPIRLDVEFGGIIKDPWGNTKAGFSISGKFDRKAYGLVWQALTETGGLVASDEVRVHGSIQLIRQG